MIIPGSVNHNSRPSAVLTLILMLNFHFYSVAGTFDPQKIFIYCKESDLEGIYSNPGENRYIPVQVAYQTQRWDSVKMRIRGDTSREFPKKSLRLKFRKEKPFANGNTILNIDAQELDASWIRQTLATIVMNRAGYPCFTAVPVVVYINDKNNGLYLEIENVDEKFLSARNYPPENNLYKAARDGACLSVHERVDSVWEMKTGRDTTFADLKSLIKSLDETPEENFYSFIKQKFDYEKLIRLFALNLLIGNSSTYYHNYYMYHDLKSDKWTMFPWDMDNTFFNEDANRLYQTGNNSDNFDSNMPSNPLFERCISNRQILNDIIAETRRLHETIFTRENLYPLIDSICAGINQYVAVNSVAPENKTGAWKLGVASVKAFIDRRYDLLDYQFAHSPTSFRLSKPRNENGRIVLSWQRSADPDKSNVSYTLKYGADKFYSPDQTKEFSSKDTAVTIGDKLPAGLYFWKVIANDGEFQIPGFDNYSTFTVK